MLQVKTSTSPRLVLLITALGLMAFLVGTFTLPFNQGLFSKLFTRPFSHAASTNIIDMAYPCGFTNPAFCDNFSEGPAAVKGRGNDLDLNRWSFNRETGDSNGLGSMYQWAIIPQVQHCKSLVPGVQADNDSFFCGYEAPEPEHWMEAFDDGGSVTTNNGRIRQPFDFTNRTGTIQYGVDAKNSGTHGWWLETWITDQPTPVSHNTPGSGDNDLPRNGIGIRFVNQCNAPAPPDLATNGYGQTGPGAVEVVNYGVTDYTFSSAEEIPSNSPQNCFKTKADSSNLIQIKLSTTRLEVWASDNGSNNLVERYAVNLNPPLPFSVGYVNFVHVGYNAEKCFDNQTIFCNHYQTYHWHDMGFDGPIHPTPKAYEIPDSLTPSSNTTQDGSPAVNLAYMVQSDGTIWDGAKSMPGFTFSNVDLSNAASARLNFTSYGFSPGNHILYQWNNGPWRTYGFPGPSPYPPDGQFWAGDMANTVPVTLSDLQPGTNVLHLKTDASVFTVGPNTVQLANIELEIAPPDSSTPAPPVPMIPCPQLQLMMAVMPDMQMPSNPCMMSPQPSGNSNLNVTLAPTPQAIEPNWTETLNTTITNTTPAPINGVIKISILDPGNRVVYTTLVDNGAVMQFMPNMPMSHSISWTPPSGSFGIYTVEETITSQDGSIVYYSSPMGQTFFTVSTTSPFPTPSPCSSNCPTPTPMPSTTPMPTPTPTPSSSPNTWINVTSNLANMPSECGNLTMLSPVPGGNNVVAGVALDGLWQSSNGGTSWSQLGTGNGSAVITNRPSWISYDPTGSNIFWESGIYNGGGAYRTADSGNTFQQLGSVTHDDFISIDFTDPNRKTILAGGHEQSQSVWKSTDGGQTWTNIGLNLPSGTGFSSDPLVINAQTYVVNTDTSWGGGTPGVYRTTNGGQTWTKVSSFDPTGAPLYDAGGTIYWASGGGLIKSADQGLTWTVVGSGLQTVHPIELPDGRLVSVGLNNLVISSDGGNTWSPIGPALPYVPAGVIYSPGVKAFFIWTWDCGSVVLPNAIMKLSYDFGFPTPTPSSSSSPTPRPSVTPTPSPSATPSRLQGDVNGDGIIDLGDFSALSIDYGKPLSQAEFPGDDVDQDNSGVVDLGDVSKFIIIYQGIYGI